mgnify:CR=1 FL=1
MIEQQGLQTLGEFIIDKQEDFKYTTGELSRLLSSIRLASKIVNREVNKAGIADIIGRAGNTNVQGEEQQKLDVLANEIFITALSNREVVCGIASEENDDFIEIKSGEIHAVMGPNGAGKSTLASAIMGHPKYEVDGGSILLDNEEVLDMEVDERARAGLFLAMQYPSEVPGVPTSEFIKSAINATREDSIPLMQYIKKLDKTMNFLEMDLKMSQRYVNDGFSGGEKKRNEILQMMMLEPKFAILDEIDSGLDIDALKIVSKGVNKMRGENFGCLIITHYQRLLDYIEPDFVHVLMDGKIVKTGGPELALRLEKEGYDWLKEEV